MPHPHQRAAEVVETLRLTAEQREALHALLDGYRSDQYHRENRENLRFAFRSNKPLPVRMQHPGGTVTTYLVQPRDLSRSGFGFVHGGYFHPGSVCDVILPDKDGQLLKLKGRVARCQLISGKAHIVGVALDEMIRLESFDVEPIDAGGSGPVTPADAAPKMLVSERAEDPRVRRALPEGVEQLNATARDVVHALDAERIALAEQLCGRLRVLADKLGYPEIGATAATLNQSFARGRIDPSCKCHLLDLSELVGSARRGLPRAA